MPPVEPGSQGVAALAGAQHGLVTRGQLVTLGLSAKAIEHRVRVGWLHRLHRGVFAVGHVSLAEPAYHAAALLYAGENTVLSHETAAALWGLTANPSVVAVTMIGRHARRQPNLRIHEVKRLDIRDARLHHGFPVTSPARTLIDCATGKTIHRLLNEARVLKLVSDAAIDAAIGRCPGRTGTGPLRAVLEAERETGFTRSRAERLLKRIARAARLDAPITNTHVEGAEVDAYWPRYRLVVEIDGYQAHGHHRAFQRDRAKTNRLIAAGYLVLRFTWHQLTDEPMVVLAEIVRAQALRAGAVLT